MDGTLYKIWQIFWPRAISQFFFLQNWANLEITLKTFDALIPEPLIVARPATTLKKALNLIYNLSYIPMTWD